MSILLSLLIYFQRQSSLYCQKMGEKYQQDHVVNFNDKHSYVVGIPVSPSTLYVDHPLDNRAVQPPNELGIRRKNTTSFQITSVTVQGSRLNNEDFEDSADDFDESHTDDISSDILDSSRITEPDGYQSEDTCNTNCEDMSPCGPIIIAQLPSNNNESSINVGLGIGMSPTFSPMVSSGVTMMTSSSESPVNTQVPMINPLPDNWQHRFKVVKIVSSEPFKRGRWVCMDFVDPPTHSHDSNEKCDVPSIHVTSCNSNTQGSQHLNVGSAVAHVFEIPMNQSYPGVPSLNSQQNSQQFYGIILPQNSNPYQSINQVTLVQNVGSQTADYTNLNHLPELQNQNSQHQARTYSQLDNFLQNQINISTPASMPSMSMNQPRVITSNNMMDNVRSVSSANGHNSSFSVPNQVSFPVNISNSVDIQSNSVALNAVTVPPDKHTTASRSSMKNEDSESSQSIPEKLSVAELGQDLDPATGSAASTGVNTVAIDNKIEQAMDLVKSHLMFAVREEVEVLKEKITELLERISQLEHENDILRANASPETLKQLNQSQKKNITGQSAHMLVGKQQKAPHMQVQPSSS